MKMEENEKTTKVWKAYVECDLYLKFSAKWRL